MADTNPNVQILWVTGGNVTLDAADEFLQRVSHYGLQDRLEWIHNLDYRAMGDLYRECARSAEF